MLIRIEKHIKSDKILFDYCHKAKNLYNKANYYVRQTFIESSLLKENGLIDNAIWIGYYDLCKILKNDETYKALPAQTAQAILRLLDKNWKSFFKAIKDFKINPHKYNGRPKPPKYLDKSGLFVCITPGQKVEYKNNSFKIPKTNYFIKTKVKKSELKEIRLVPINNYKIKIEIVYEKQTTDLNLNKNNVLGIDLGVNNLMAITSNQEQPLLYLVNGRQIKSINQYYNKQVAKKTALLKKLNNTYCSKSINKLNYKRNNKIEDYFHKASKHLIDICIKNNIGKIVIGKNINWKQDINIGKKNNQNFVSTPFNKLIQMITYKAEQVSIKVILTEESYTSKIDHLVNEPMIHSDNYLGKRIKRGLFKSSTNILLNADINGSFGMLRKINAVNKNYFNNLVNRGCVFQPVKLNF
jgi:putative transposase